MIRVHEFGSFIKINKNDVSSNLPIDCTKSDSAFLMCSLILGQGLYKKKLKDN